MRPRLEAVDIHLQARRMNTNPCCSSTPTWLYVPRPPPQARSREPAGLDTSHYRLQQRALLPWRPGGTLVAQHSAYQNAALSSHGPRSPRLSAFPRVQRQGCRTRAADLDRRSSAEDAPATARHVSGKVDQGDTATHLSCCGAACGILAIIDRSHTGRPGPGVLADRVRGLVGKRFARRRSIQRFLRGLPTLSRGPADSDGNLGKQD